MTGARGIDVSKAQGTVSWPAVTGAGYVFAYIKATDGQDYVDPDFKANWTGAAQAGLLRGAYHFFRAEDSPEVQANFFWNTVNGMGSGAGDLPLVVDIERTWIRPTASCSRTSTSSCKTLNVYPAGSR